MDEVTFQAALRRFPVLRPRNAANIFTLKRARPALLAAAGAGAGAGAAGAGGARPAAAAPRALPSSAAPAPAALKNFWQGLPALLAAHFEPADAKAVGAAFDSLHYAGLRALSWDDVQDLATMMDAECAAEEEARRAAAGERA